MFLYRPSGFFIKAMVTGLLLMNSIFSRAQENSATKGMQELIADFDTLAVHYPLEKMYLHFDKPCYVIGDTIWFKAYFMSDTRPSAVSKTFYMDWANDSGRIISHNSYPIAFASTHGQFTIPEDYAGKQLHIQAYTKWMLNFDSSFLYKKTIHIVQNNIASNDLSDTRDTIYFFPEGGDMIAGLKNKIAFKAVNNNQAPITVSGMISDYSGHVIDSFQSRHDGMGYFYLEPKAGEKYNVTWKDENNQLHHSLLPLARLSGVTLQIQPDGGKRKFIIQRTGKVEEPLRQLHLAATQQQQLVFEADINLDEQEEVEASIPVSELPSGILRFTLFDKNWLPVAERISFVNNGEYLFSPTINADTVSFEKRGLNVLSIEVPDSLTANLSIAITDADIVKPDSSDNIISHLLLSSELKGIIYHPAYYFKDNSLQTQQDLDLVMLTNGWRRYNWQKILQGEYPSLKYPKDSAYLYFSGKLENMSNTVRKVITDNSAKHLLIFSLRSLHDTLSQFLPLALDSNGRFGKPGLLVFDSLVVGYQFSDKKANSRSPEISFMPGRINEPVHIRMDPSLENYAEDKTLLSMQNPDIAEAKSRLLSRRRGILLKTVTVATKAKTREEEMEEAYTSPSMFRGAFGYNVDVMDDKNARLNGNIFEYLQQNSKGGLQITISPKGMPSLNWSGGRGEPGIYYNETKVPVVFMLNISMSEIAYVKTIPPPPFTIDSTAGAVAVYSKKGEDYYKSLPTKINQQTIIGYSVIKEFYSPEYGTENKDNNAPDLRTTLYWNPMIITRPDNGHVKIRFYNNDDSKAYRIVLEGMTREGKLTKVEKVIDHSSKP